MEYPFGEEPIEDVWEMREGRRTKPSVISSFSPAASPKRPPKTPTRLSSNACLMKVSSESRDIFCITGRGQSCSLFFVPLCAYTCFHLVFIYLFILHYLILPAGCFVAPQSQGFNPPQVLQLLLTAATAARQADRLLQTVVWVSCESCPSVWPLVISCWFVQGLTPPGGSGDPETLSAVREMIENQWMDGFSIQIRLQNNLEGSYYDCMELILDWKSGCVPSSIKFSLLAWTDEVALLIFFPQLPLWMMT